MQTALKELQKLFKRTEKVDYDIDAYARDMAAMLNTFPDAAVLKGWQIDALCYHSRLIHIVLKHFLNIRKKYCYFLITTLYFRQKLH